MRLRGGQVSLYIYISQSDWIFGDHFEDANNIVQAQGL